MDANSRQETIENFRNKITEEFVAMFGFPRAGLARRLISPLFRPVATRFADIIARFDAATLQGGIGTGARHMLDDFDIRIQTAGAELIPAEGPLLVACNHPGTYDSLVLAACIGRNDLSLLVSDVPFMHAFRNAGSHLIRVARDPADRMISLRKSIRHLQDGGALLLFGRGEVEPDPSFMSGAEEELARWSRSIEVMLRKAPGAVLQIAIASGVLLPGLFTIF